ncbi:MAG TPA: hypothetical protein VGF55_16250 [Gemmataceae bacterium]|jgi:hypothetical protein
MNRSRLLGLCAAVALVAAAGCTAKKPVLSGVVTLDGQPLDNGSITFIPVAGDGQTAGATLGPDGRYRVAVSPTKMKVVIRAAKVVGKRKMYETPDSPMVEIYEEVLPARYSDTNKSELTVTVEPGEHEHDFPLTSDKGKK